MVGIVIISHSAKVAEGAKEIALQMAPEVAIAACGGSNDGGIGTDPDRIASGIAEVSAGDGVVILVDLGSAVMSAELIIDTLSDEMRAQVLIANAPVVEGAVMAAVEASMEKDLAEVLAAAESAARMTKIEREV